MNNYKIYLINMDRSKDRLEKISKQLELQSLNFTRIQGVDVSTLSDIEIKERYSENLAKKTFHRKLRNGEIGCYISHQNAWKKIVEDNVDFGIVLEDDILILDNFSRGIKFLDNNQDKWQFSRIQIEVKAKKFYSSTKSKDSEFYFAEYIKSSGTTFGYAITKETAKTLLENLVPFGMTADTNIHFYHKYNIATNALREPIVSADYSDFSIISEVSNPEKSFSSYIKKKFAVRSYVSRLFFLLKRDGIFKFFYSLLKMPFSGTTEIVKKNYYKPPTV